MYSQEHYLAYYFIIICTLILLVLGLAITVLSFRYQKNQILNANGILDLKTNHQEDLLKTQIQVQEQTFQNISREIHDNIAQKLTLAKLQLNLIEFPGDKKMQSNISSIINLISESLNDLRDISRSLSSEVIISNGLIKALESEIIQLNKTGQYNIKLTIVGDSFFMEAYRELAIFRIIQESLNNILKHAEATQVNIDFHFSNAALAIKIIDNGVGFNIAEISNANGVNNIKNRAITLGGEAFIESVISVGTTVHIKIPQYESTKM
jgi:signal transduction histidine kinase